MPPIGEKLTDVLIPPQISSEQQEVIANREIEIGKRIDTMAPPIGDYMVWPLYPTDDLTLTMSGCATYEVNGKAVAAFVTRDLNNDVKLRTILYEKVPEGPFSLQEYGATIKRGAVVGVSSNRYDRGRLSYLNVGRNYAGLKTFEQNIDALSNIDETLDLIAAANLSTYGVASFDGLSSSELVAIRERAEPGLIDFIEQSLQEDVAYQRSQ